MLSRIYGPENYEFCTYCKYLDVGGNDWFCDSHFLKFLMWISKTKLDPQRKTTLFGFYGRCKNLAEYGEFVTSVRSLEPDGIYSKIISTAFTQEYLEEVANYTRYMKSPPNDACM